MRDIGKNIKDLRVRKNMTQDELAEKLFVTRQTVSNYETGKSRPDIDMLERIAAVLETDIQQLLYGPAPTVEKEKLRRLVTGAALTLLFAVIYLALEPMSNFLRARYYITGFHIFRVIFLTGLLFLFLGWTLAQLLGMALKKAPIRAGWAKYIRWALVLLVCFILIAQLSWFIPLLSAEYRFYNATGDRSFSDYYQISSWAKSVSNIVLALFSTQNSYVQMIPTMLGALLWLFGFPEGRPSQKNN